MIFWTAPRSIRHDRLGVNDAVLRIQSAVE